MRQLSIATGMLALALGLSAPAQAQQSHFQGFGGLTFGDVTNSTTFGGTVAIPLSENLQIIGEGGRLTDVMPSLAGTLIDFTPFDLRVSAWYGEAGLRFMVPSGGAIRPYVETTGGFARLTTGFTGADSRADSILNASLGFLDRTEPMLGAGFGIVVQGGPMFVDLGYRYKRILAADSVQRLLTGGNIGVNQVRIGAGVRF
jgi:hypothetical protein